jgi:hypothetical protein
VRADFVRATVKVDVRDASGKAVEAEVTVRPESGGEPQKVARVGDVYVTEGLIDGVWLVEVQGAPTERVRVHGRQTAGVVVVIGSKPAPAAKKKSKESGAGFTVAPSETVCDDDKGTVVEAVAYGRTGLGAGRLEVRAKGRLVCSATIAGGGATLRLQPGVYDVSARFVGGGSAKAGFLVGTKTASPLMLKAK